MKKEYYELAKAKAINYGFEDAIYRGKWHGFEIYDATTTGDVPCLGFPFYYLVDDNGLITVFQNSKEYQSIEAIRLGYKELTDDEFEQEYNDLRKEYENNEEALKFISSEKAEFVYPDIVRNIIIRYYNPSQSTAPSDEDEYWDWVIGESDAEETD